MWAICGSVGLSAAFANWAVPSSSMAARAAVCRIGMKSPSSAREQRAGLCFRLTVIGCGKVANVPKETRERSAFQAEPTHDRLGQPFAASAGEGERIEQNGPDLILER